MPDTLNSGKVPTGITPRYLTYDAAAEYLCTSHKALERRVQRNTIPYIKDGRRIKFDVRALDQYMADGAVTVKKRRPRKR